MILCILGAIIGRSSIQSTLAILALSMAVALLRALLIVSIPSLIQLEWLLDLAAIALLI